MSQYFQPGDIAVSQNCRPENSGRLVVVLEVNLTWHDPQDGSFRPYLVRHVDGHPILNIHAGRPHLLAKAWARPDQLKRPKIEPDDIAESVDHSAEVRILVEA